MTIFRDGPPRVTTLTLGAAGAVGPLAVLYSIEVSRQEAGEFILLGFCEVTNDLAFNVELGLKVVDASLANGGQLAVAGARFVVEAAADNVVPAEHHQVRPVMTIDTHPGGRRFYNLVGYVAANSAVGGEIVTVEPIGHMNIRFLQGNG